MYIRRFSTRRILTDVSFFHLWILPRIPDVTDSSPSEGGLFRKKAIIIFHIIFDRNTRHICIFSNEAKCDMRKNQNCNEKNYTRNINDKKKQNVYN